jgi:putative addiction module killer protein
MYQTEDNRVPFDDWLNSIQDKSTQNAIINRIDRMELGSTANFRPVGEGVTELKIDRGPGYRVYFGQDGETLIILLAGGDKSTQDKDCAKAKEYWREYNA